MSVGCVGYSCLSGSLRCVGTSQAKTSGVELHAEVMNFCSVWHSAHVVTWVLGMKCVCCTIGMCCGFTVELSGLNLGSSSFRNVDEISIQGSVCAE